MKKLEINEMEKTKGGVSCFLVGFALPLMSLGIGLCSYSISEVARCWNS